MEAVARRHASPETLNTPELNVAVAAALAGGLAATIAAAPSTTPPSSRRVARRQSLLCASFIVVWARRMMISSSRDGARRPVRSMQGRVHAGDAAHHRLDVTFGTYAAGDKPGSDVPPEGPLALWRR